MNYDVCRTNIEQTEREIKMNDNNLGNRITDLLKRSGLTQRELADRVGVTEITMTHIINGDRIPKGPIIANIANALHTTTDYLLGTEEKKDTAEVATKEQERKAIQKIRKIVEELGENSYVGFAMEGVLELAEDNIREDTAYSMKKNAEIAWERADKAEKENKYLKKEVEDLKKTVKKRRTTISELNTELCNARAKAKANEVPEELIQEMYCMAYDKEAELIGKMERTADQMTEATIAGEDAHGFAEEYKKQKENRNRYRKVMEMLDQRERRRAGR